MAKGSLGTVREGVKRAQGDLGANEYRGIDGRHRKQQIEMHSTDRSAADLDRCHKARASRRLFQPLQLGALLFPSSPPLCMVQPI